MLTYKSALGGREVAIHAPRAGEFDDDARRMLLEDLHGAGVMLGLDVESTAHDKLGPMHKDFRVRTVQLASDSVAYVLRLDDPLQRETARLLLNHQPYKFCSHTRYDVLAVWREFGVDISGRWADTRLLARMAHPLSLDRWNKRRGSALVDLKSLTTRHFGPELQELDEALDAHFKELWVAQGGRKNAAKEVVVQYGFNNVDLAHETFATYAGLDAIACRSLYPILLAETRSTPELIGMEMWLAGSVARMQMRGMRVDHERLAAELAAAEEVCGSAEEELVELIGLTPRQAKRLVEFFRAEGVDFEAHGHELTDAGQPKLDKDGVAAMADYEMSHTARLAVNLLITYKSEQYTATKAAEMQGLVAESFDGRLHPSVDSLGAITARMTASAPNIQNFSKADPRMRATLLPDEGYVLIGADFDQIELRVVAALAQEQSMLETIWSGGDLHQLTADKLNVPRDPVAKRVNFLQVYGGGPKPLAKATGISIEAAQEASAAYKQAYPAVQRYGYMLGRSGAEIRTMTHRHIPATFYKGEPAGYRFLNYMIQSSSRDILVTAWYRLAKAGIGEFMFVPIHDEMILMVPEDRVDEAMAILEQAMTMDFLGVPITATAVPLIDEDGVSRWMTCNRAEKVRDARLAAEAGLAAAS